MTENARSHSAAQAAAKYEIIARYDLRLDASPLVVAATLLGNAASELAALIRQVDRKPAPSGMAQRAARCQALIADVVKLARLCVSDPLAAVTADLGELDPDEELDDQFPDVAAALAVADYSLDEIDEADCQRDEFMPRLLPEVAPSPDEPRLQAMEDAITAAIAQARPPRPNARNDHGPLDRLAITTRLLVIAMDWMAELLSLGDEADLDADGVMAAAIVVSAAH